MMKKTVLLLSGLLFFGCSQKESVKYYLPVSKGIERGTAQVSVDSVSYLSGDRIWYKKEGVFLPYKNSYLAKTPKEFMESELQNTGVGGMLSVFLADAYQSYESEKSSFVLAARAELQTVDGSKKYKAFRVEKNGFGTGAAEGVRGFEECAAELTKQIKTEFGGKNK